MHTVCVHSVLGETALGKALKTSSTLTILYLQNNSIGDNGAQRLSEALKTNSTLTTLDLWGNSIGDSRVLEPSDALKTNSALTTLGLACNLIGDNGALVLAQEFLQRFYSTLNAFSNLKA
ncbi:hypothetical protein BGZ82_008269 [Podila clonocystis]|nr:hypothetical protein BGZ82_008269 [Podila clonocystis]